MVPALIRWKIAPYREVTPHEKLDAAIRVLGAEAKAHLEKISQPMGITKQGGGMDKRKKSGKAKVSKARPVNPETGFRVGSFANTAATAYLKATTREGAVAAVERAAVTYFSAKKRKDAPAYAHRQACGWVCYLPKCDGKLFKELPRAEKVSKSKVAKKPAAKKVEVKEPAVA